MYTTQWQFQLGAMRNNEDYYHDEKLIQSAMRQIAGRENASIKYRRRVYRRIAICQIIRAAITREFNYTLSMFCCVDKPRGR